jgi:hypothetical protein
LTQVKSAISSCVAGAVMARLIKDNAHELLALDEP